MCRYFFFLLWSNIIFGLTVFLFQRGFLLSREVLADKTKCEKTTKNDSCYAVPREYSKAIVLIIDALRYDFAAYDKNLSMTKPYQNAMPIINQLIEKGQGKLYQSFADPPTTTMQRLKGLTTGSIPTFIDVSANFASYEINEDNIIDQLIERGRKVVFAGDDTWLSLFPNRFTRTYPFPSFDVWDLDTGHQPTFPTIQWSAAFVGFSGANYGTSTATYWLPAVLIGVNTFAARILFTFMVPLLLVAPFTVYKVLQDTEHPFLNLAPFEESLDEGETVLIEQIDEATSHMFRLCLKYSAILGLKMLASMVSAAHHRRHLMVWKIFAPRFIFEGIGFGVGLGVLCLSYLTFLRIQASLSRFHHELTKNK